MPTSTDDAVARFMDDVTGLISTSGAGSETSASMGELLRRLAEQPGILTDERLATLHGSASKGAILAERPEGPVLMLARFPEDTPTPVHNHNSWGVICVIQGEDRHVRWERLDDGLDPTHADLRIAEAKGLGAGDVLFFGEPPEDIHSQQGVGGPAWELVLFGRNPDALPRAYFDPNTGAVTYKSAFR